MKHTLPEINGDIAHGEPSDVGILRMKSNTVEIVDAPRISSPINEAYKKWCEESGLIRWGSLNNMDSFWVILRYSPKYDTREHLMQIPFGKSLVEFLGLNGIVYNPEGWELSFDIAEVNPNHFRSNPVKMTYTRTIQ